MANSYCTRLVVGVWTLLVCYFSTQVNSFKPYKFHITSERNFSQQMNNILYLSGPELVIKCQLYDTEHDGSEERHHLVHAFQMLGHSPIITFSNRSWQQTFLFPVYMTGDHQAWTVTVPRDNISTQATDGVSMEQWLVTVAMDTGVHLFQSFGTLLDIENEPLLRWVLGDPVDSLPDSVTSDNDVQIKTIKSPCASDIALLLLTHYPGDYGRVIGVTYSSFSNEVKWYNISSVDGLCNSTLTSTYCSDMYIIDGILTNYHLMLLTNAGLLISENLTGQSHATRNSSIRFTLERFSGLPLGAVFQKGDLTERNITISNPGYCDCRHYDRFREEILTIVYQNLSSPQVTSVSMYSHKPYSSWYMPYQVVAPPIGLAYVLSMAHNIHTNALVVLYQTQGGSQTLEVRQLMEPSSIPHTHTMFPPYNFPPSFHVRGIAFHPITQLLYAYGNQVWLSTDGGNSFDPIFRLTNDMVVSMTAGFHDGVVVMTTEAGDTLYGKAGVPRLGILRCVNGSTGRHSSIHIDFVGDIFRVTLTNQNSQNGSSPVHIEQLDISSIQLLDVSFPHPLVYQFLSASEIFLHEHRPLTSPGINATSQFYRAHVGMKISLKSGGSAVIKQIIPTHHVSGFLSAVRAHLIEPYPYESLTQSPAQLRDIKVEISNTFDGAAMLVLTSNAVNGWLLGDVGKTVLLPQGDSFLLTEYVNATHILASCTLLGVEERTVQAAHWYMYDFSANDTQAMWTLTEDQCRHEMSVDTVIQEKSLFELDIGDLLTLTATANTAGSSPVLPSGQLLHAMFSNPIRYRIRSRLSTSHLGYQTLTVHVEDDILEWTMTAVTFNLPMASLLCPKTSHSVVVVSGCPFHKRLVAIYPRILSDQEVLYADPKDEDERSLLYNLVPNYRPPSKHGIDIPICDNMYNVHPELPRPKNTYRVSKLSGVPDQCANKPTRAACGCTDEMKLSALPEFSDCRERVYRMKHPGRLFLKMKILEPGKPDEDLAEPYIISVTENNNRLDYSLQSEPSLILQQMRKDSRFMHIPNLHNPSHVELIMTGSGLYHFRVTMLSGQSYCNLETYYLFYMDVEPMAFQFYIDDEPMAFPGQYLLNFSTAFLVGLVLFIVYLWYLAKHHEHKIRRVGSQCLDLSQITAMQLEKMQRQMKK